jgi:hypothetical protein
MNTEERQAFRRRLEDLSENELLQRLFLIGLVGRISTEMAAYHALFSSESELPTGLGDTQLAGIQLMFTQELKRRSVAKSKVQKLPIDTEEGETNHAENTGTH